MKTSIGVLVFLWASVGFGQSGSYLITTIAGLGNLPATRPVDSGDGGPAFYAGLSAPGAMAFDSAGNLYIADGSDVNSGAGGVIRKITPQGIISTVAGGGTALGDGGPATSALVSNPSGVAVDASGNLYVSSSQGIRIVTPQGTITTLAGIVEPAYDPMGLAFDQVGNLYIADMMNCVVRMMTPQGILSTVAGVRCDDAFSGDDGPATSADLYYPRAVAVDSSGNLYIADDGNDRIRKVTPQDIISTIAGGGTNGLGDGGPATSAVVYSPVGVAVDQSGNLFIVDGSYRIRMVTPEGSITTVAGTGSFGSDCIQNDGGPATNSSFAPNGITLDGKGNMFISTSLWSGYCNYSQVRKLIQASTIGCTYGIDQSSYSVTIAGGSNTVGVLSSASSCAWMAVSEAEWITPVTPTGIETGLGLVTYTATPIESSIPRSGTVWIAGNSLTINQAGIVCSINVSPKNITVGTSGAVGLAVGVSATAQDCQWIAVANEPWILVNPNTRVMGNLTLSASFSPNIGGLRTGSLTVAGQAISVIQYGKPGCNVTGVQQTINEALGVIPAGDDMNGDGVVNVVDAQLVTNAVFGCGLTTGRTTGSFPNLAHRQ